MAAGAYPAAGAAPVSHARLAGDEAEATSGSSGGETPARSARRGPLSAAVLWISVGLAISPAWSDLAGHWIEHGWARYSIASAILLGVAVWRDGPQRTRPVLGSSLLVLAVLAQLLGLLASLPSLLRPCVALGVMGLLLLRGTASPRVALLALWVIPVPSFALRSLGAAALDAELVRLGLALVPAFEASGLDAAQQSRILTATLDPRQGILPLVYFATGLAWYAAARLDFDRRRTLGCLAIAAIAALPVQLAAIIAVVGAASQGAPPEWLELMRAGRWAVPFALGLWSVESMSSRLARTNGAPTPDARPVGS